jgi:DNA-binding ferritin-like protein (Dps family)
MKKIVNEVQGEGLEKLLGERVTLFCMNYIYTGTLTGANETCVLLTDAAIVYETGAFNEKEWKDAQKLPHDWYVQIGAIESFGKLK